MAIELPPPLPPQSVSAADLRAASAAATIEYKTYRIHMPPGSPLDAGEVRDAIAGAVSVSELVSALAHAYYADGELSTQLLYAVDGDDVYLALYPRKIVKIDAPDALRPYFAPLAGTPLSDRDLEPRRALANVDADRAGIAAQAWLEPVEGGADLQIVPDGRKLPTNTASAEFGNPGNRFVGRHFLDLDLRHSDRSGNQFKLLWDTALTGISDGRADDYNEEGLSWDRVTTHGVWGVKAHAFDYAGHGGRDGQLREGELNWLLPVAASLHSRMLLDARVSYINRELDNGEATLREEYPSIQIGMHYAYSASPAAGPLDIDVGTTFRKGLRSDTAATGADFDYFLWRPTVSVNLALSDRWSTGMLLTGQLSNDTLPLESQWVLGGIDNIAAYLPGIAVGDIGAYGELDLQYHGWELLGVRVSPRAFVEYGLSRYERQSDEATRGTAMLSDIGTELVANWRFLEASLAIAAPIGHRRVSSALRDDSDANLLFRVSAAF
jgi:hemolysin activation/secretion protein